MSFLSQLTENFSFFNFEIFFTLKKGFSFCWNLLGKINNFFSTFFYGHIHQLLFSSLTLMFLKMYFVVCIFVCLKNKKSFIFIFFIFFISKILFTHVFSLFFVFLLIRKFVSLLKYPVEKERETWNLFLRFSCSFLIVLSSFCLSFLSSCVKCVSFVYLNVFSS